MEGLEVWTFPSDKPPVAGQREGHWTEEGFTGGEVMALYPSPRPCLLHIQKLEVSRGCYSFGLDHACTHSSDKGRLVECRYVFWAVAHIDRCDRSKSAISVYANNTSSPVPSYAGAQDAEADRGAGL